MNGELRQELRHLVDQAIRARTGRPVEPGAPDIGRTPHGTQSGYRRGCRCTQCRLAANDAKQAWRNAHREYYNAQNREYRRQMRAKRGEPEVHGTLASYTNHNCRCEACTEANRVAQAAKRTRYRREHRAPWVTP
jgi:hypothetical protein